MSCLLLILVVVVIMMSFEVSIGGGVVYKVGDSVGWTTIGNLNYMAWAANKTFHVGDSIVFEYNKEFHNVLRVTHKSFRHCNTTAPIATFNSGNDTFNVRLYGHYYFICGIPGHCESGQKVDIRVPRSISPAPTPNNPAPAPTPNNPAPAPIAPIAPVVPSPSFAPVPSPSSVVAPAPAPSKKNGASVFMVNNNMIWLSLFVLAFFV